LPERKSINDFAVKWGKKFRDEEINYIELVDHYFADECDELGFVMDSGEAFSQQYGSASYDSRELKKVINGISDIELLGSAIYSRWRYFNHWAYDGEEILEDCNRAWFILALDRLALLSEENTLRFVGKPQSIRIISNNISYGPYPDFTDEVEQHLEINDEGQVSLKAFDFGDGSKDFTKGRSIEFNIEKQISQKILNLVGAYFSQEYTEIFATDIGYWNLEIINTDGEVYFFSGSLCADLEIDGVNLSNLIRSEINIENLYLFDNNYNTDKVNKIFIDYHRVTKIRPQESIGEKEYVTWDYSEQLVIDRKTESIEHIQNIGSGCIISRKLKVQGGVEALLDDLDAESLFENIEGNPPNVIENLNETRKYKIIIDFEKKEQKTITGTYDKKGLPNDWADFAEYVLEFILFYGLGEILDPSTYNKTRRCEGEYIYLSVAFEDSYKTYFYITDDDSIEAGDFVLVPAGKDNHQAIVKVISVEYFSEEDAPLSPSKTKKIIRKSTEEDFK